MLLNEKDTLFHFLSTTSVISVIITILSWTIIIIVIGNIYIFIIIIVISDWSISSPHNLLRFLKGKWKNIYEPNIYSTTHHRFPTKDTAVDWLDFISLYPSSFFNLVGKETIRRNYVTPATVNADLLALGKNEYFF